MCETQKCKVAIAILLIGFLVISLSGLIGYAVGIISMGEVFCEKEYNATFVEYHLADQVIVCEERVETEISDGGFIVMRSYNNVYRFYEDQNQGDD